MMYLSYYYQSQGRWYQIPAYYAPKTYYGQPYTYAPNYYAPYYSAPNYWPSYYQKPHLEYQDADRHMIAPHIDYHTRIHGYAPIY